MTMHMRKLGLAFALAVLAACGGGSPASKVSSAVLSDGRTDGAPGFYFLPPVAPEPAGDTVNDPGLSPVVEIVALDAGAAVLATFEGPDIKASDSHYMALWSTKRFVPVAGTTYRIRVLLDGKELGFADAQASKDGKQLRLLASDGIFGLMGQRTVPIKFRIHVQPPDLCKDVVCAPTQCQASSACDPATGACVAQPKQAGTACDDGNPCTTGDACDGEGGCLSGTPVVCEGADACNAPTCEATGCVNHPVENGTNCTTDAGRPGYCLLDPELGRSVCTPVTPGKLTR